MRQRTPGSSSPAVLKKGNETSSSVLQQRRGAERRRESSVGGGSLAVASSGGGGAMGSTSSTTRSWEITSGGDVSVIVDHHYDDDVNDDSSHMLPNQNVALEQKTPDADLLNHPYRYGGASALFHPRQPPVGVLPPPGSSTTTSSSQYQQQYASYMRYQRIPPIAISEENLRKFGASSPWAAKSSTSSALLTSWKLDQARLQDYHTVFRTPLHVPDSEYGAFLLGGRNHRRKESMIITKEGCATACAGFSAIGVIFLLFIGILLDTQPLYIPGTLPELVVQSTFQYKHNNNNNDGDEVLTYTKPVIQYLVPGPADERLPIAATAYKAALAYVCTFLASLYVRDPTRFHWLTRWVGQHVPWGRTSSSSNAVFEYTDIPDMPTTTTNGLPLFADAAIMSRSASVSYQQPGLWNRTTDRVQRWLAVRGWYRVRRRNKNKKKG